MPRAVIMTIDDEPQVLHAVARDLRRRYGKDYQIVTAGSGAEAQAVVQRLARRNTPIALFLTDQRMPAMSGTEFLAAVRTLYPQARQVLLTAYADTQAAITSINELGLDYYLLKPWDPPEDHLYPVLDDLLADWAATVPAPYDGIRVAGIRWSLRSYEIKDFLARNRIPYQWLDVEKDPQARELVRSTLGEHQRLPVVFLPDGDHLVEPDNRTLAARIGLRTQAGAPFYDVIIAGGGPAGLGAAVYAASEGLRTALIERYSTGGQAGMSARIENYLGFPKGLSGADLARRATAQAERFGTDLLTALAVERVRVEPPYKILTLSDGSELTCKALVIATGMTTQKLAVPGAEAVTGMGLYYGTAATEAAAHEGEHVLVVGGANSAGQGAVFLARFASQVTVLVRGPSIRASMSSYLVDQIEATPNIEVRHNAEVVAVHGDQRFTGATIRDRRDGTTAFIGAGAMFVFIGAVPHTGMVADVVRRNAHGFILTGPDLLADGRRRPQGWQPDRDPYLLETSVPGIFAAGDCRHGVIRRIATAVGEGALAVSFVHRYLETV